MDEKRSLGEEIGRRSFGVMWMDEEGRLMQELDDARTPAAGSSSANRRRVKGIGSYGGVDTPGGALAVAILLFVVAAVIINFFVGE